MAGQNHKNEFTSRFSETAEKIIRDSERIAATNNGPIGSEHLLAALTSSPGTVAYEALRELSVTPERVAFATEALASTFGSSKLAITEDIKSALKGAYQKAAFYGSPSVETEHILLAIVANRQSHAYQVLNQLGIEPTTIKEQLEHYFEDSAEVVSSNYNFDEHDHQDESGEFSNYQSHEPSHGRPSREATKPKTALEYFTTDLTKQARANKLDPVIGRTAEITRMIQILVRRTKNNPVLTGEPGVGKTAIVEGLASRIASGDVPRQLADKRVLSLDLALLISGTTYRGQFEERTKKLVDEIIKAGNVILFLDELHTIVGAGAAEGSMDLGHILKPALAKGQLRLVGATTNDEYRKYIEKDPALERRFQRVRVEEPSVEETVAILEGLRPTYEKHHSVSISPEAMEAAALMAKRYISDRFLPDKAIDLIDEAAAATQLEPQQLKMNNKIIELETKRRQANQEHQKAAENFDYERSAAWRVQELRMLNELEQLKKTLPKRQPERQITLEDIARVVSQWTGIPVTTLNKTERLKLVGLDKTLAKEIIGQEEAIKAISESVRRSSAGVADPNRPLGSFIFLGPTGVGKTELVKVLARTVYGSESALIKIDMSEFMERHNTSRLVGAPPGYVGYEDAGKLTEQVRKNPYSLVLFDEIEKAHPDVFNLLLQVLEDGYLTDAKGRRVNFQQTIIVMTSNIGQESLNKQQAIGFKLGSAGQGEQEYQKLKAEVLDKLKDNFRPEFINRLDDIIVFKPLGQTEVKQIVDRELTKLLTRLAPTGFQLEVSEPAREFLASVGFDPKFGARPVRRAITKYVENPLADLILTGKVKPDSQMRLLKKGEKLVIVK